MANPTMRLISPAQGPVAYGSRALVSISRIDSSHGTLLEGFALLVDWNGKFAASEAIGGADWFVKR